MFCRHCGNHVSLTDWVARARRCIDCFVESDRGGRWDND